MDNEKIEIPIIGKVIPDEKLGNKIIWDEIEEENAVIKECVDEFKKEESSKLVNKEQEFVNEFDKDFIKERRKEYVEYKIKHLEDYYAFLLDWYFDYTKKDYPYFLRERPVNDALRVMGSIKKHKMELRWLENPELIRGEITSDMIKKAKEFPIKTLLNTEKDFVKCPFHNEKTASMYLKNNFYHCFSCKETGDTIDLLMKRDKMTFPEAVKRLI